MGLRSTATEKPEMERRTDARYRLDVPVVGYIEHNLQRYSGRVIDVSVSGFQIFVPRTIGMNFDLLWATDFGEISIQGQLVGGFGRGAYISRVASGVFVGFEWDEYVFETHWLALTTLIGYLDSQNNDVHELGSDTHFVAVGDVDNRVQHWVG